MFARVMLVASLGILAGCFSPNSRTVRLGKNSTAHRGQLHPWIAAQLDQDMTLVKGAIQQRLTNTDSPELLALANRIREFDPQSIEFSHGTAYVLSYRVDPTGRHVGTVTNNFYLAQPPVDTDLVARVAFYDEEVRPLLKSFWSMYAGAGEEMSEGYAGQFLLRDTAASDYDSDPEERFGKWKDAKVLYQARNGDLLLINHAGATAWHVMETGENEPLASTFPEFLQHYTAFLGSDVFDSHASRAFLANPLSLNP